MPNPPSVVAPVIGEPLVAGPLAAAPIVVAVICFKTDSERPTFKFSQYENFVYELPKVRETKPVSANSW